MEYRGKPRLIVIENDVNIGTCDKCGRSSKVVSKPGSFGHKVEIPCYVVKVIGGKEGKEHWRCSTCVSSLDRDIANKLRILEYRYKWVGKEMGNQHTL